MRPVNLIPPEERHGRNTPLRSGPLPYVVVGALIALLAGVVGFVLTSNQVAEHRAQITTLEREDAIVSARAARLAAYTQLRTLHEQRVTTVASLADSRFDWERVMRELALIMPHDVWLVSLTASASPTSGVTGGNGGSGNLRASIPGPALELSGCATGHEAVAGFVTALEQIDGVTRVGVQASELGSSKSGAAVAGGKGSNTGGEDCRTRNFISKFSIVVAFDAAPVQGNPSATPAQAAATEQAQTTSAETSGH